MGRLIDEDEAIATRNLKVCCIGLPRTCTTSLAIALESLGYRTYHGFEYVKNGKRDMDLLHEALTLKNTPEAYTRLDFDKIFGKYSAVADLLGFAFVDELVIMYPEAKFILTDRDSHAWLRVMQDSVFAYMSSWSTFFQSLYDFEHMRPLRRLMRKWAEVFCGLDFHEGARQAYIAHVQHCLKVVPKERLLVMRLEEQLDWEDLCAFLEVPVPDQEKLGQNECTVEMDDSEARESEDPSTWLALATVAVTIAGGLLFLWLVT